MPMAIPSPLTPSSAYEQVARMLAEVLRGGGGIGRPQTLQPGPFPGALPLVAGNKTYGPTGQPFRTPPPAAAALHLQLAA